MPITSARLDGENVGITLAAPSLAADVIVLDIVSGLVTSGVGANGPFFDAGDTKFLTEGAAELFSIVPFASRAAAAQRLLTKLVQVSAADAGVLTLSAAPVGPSSFALRATVAAPGAVLVAHISHSIIGALTSPGDGGGGGGGGGLPVGPAGGVLGYSNPDGTDPSTYPNPNGLAGIVTPAVPLGTVEIRVRNTGDDVRLRLTEGSPGAPSPSSFAIQSSDGVQGTDLDTGVDAGGLTLFGGLGADAFGSPAATRDATAGGDVDISAGDGGDADTGPLGTGASGAAGAITVFAGIGGSAKFDKDAKSGGDVSISAGPGGSADLADPLATGKAGGGGALSMQAGAGLVAGLNVAADAGAGGNALLAAGVGGDAASGGGGAGKGGLVSITAGDGGDGAATVGMITRPGEDGGLVEVIGGDGGTPMMGGFSGGKGGDVKLVAGVSGQPVVFGPPFTINQNDGRIYMEGIPAFVPNPGGLPFDLLAPSINHALGPAQYGTIYLTASAGDVTVGNIVGGIPSVVNFLAPGKYEGEVVRLVNVDAANKIDLFREDNPQTIFTGLALGAASRTLEAKGGNITLMWCNVSAVGTFKWLEVAYTQGPCYAGP